ncbi:hypothetical protein BDW75DRAFT_149752 [Aspergillus navahoensis]
MFMLCSWNIPNSWYLALCLLGSKSRPWNGPATVYTTAEVRRGLWASPGHRPHRLDCIIVGQIQRAKTLEPRLARITWVPQYNTKEIVIICRVRINNIHLREIDPYIPG